MDVVAAAAFARCRRCNIGRHLVADDLNPPLRAVFIYNHNPIVVHPDQNRMRRGLLRDNVFTVSVDVTTIESLTHRMWCCRRRRISNMPICIWRIAIIGCSVLKRRWSC